MEFKLKELKTCLSVSRIANVHYFEFTNEYTTFKDQHPFKELIYVDSGSINVYSEGFNGTLNAKQFLIHKSNEVHSLSCIGTEVTNVIIIGFECFCKELDKFSVTPLTLTNEQILVLTEIIKEGRSVFLPPYDVPNIKNMKKKQNPPFGSEQVLRLKLELLLIDLIRMTKNINTANNNNNQNKKIDEIYQYITEHYTEKITLDDLCFLFATNKTTLCNSFKETYGETVISYINRIRIKAAKKLMREGDYNLTELSSKLGFSSIHYFSRTFKSYNSQSPTEYLKAYKTKL